MYHCWACCTAGLSVADRGSVPPAIVVDCAAVGATRAATEGHEHVPEMAGVRRGAVRLAQSSGGDESLAERLASCSSDGSTGRVFKRGTDVEVEATATETDVVQWRSLYPR